MSEGESQAAREASVYIDGEMFPPEEARISVFDSGLNFADGVFEGIRVYAGRVFRLDRHLRRLFQSARAFEIDIGMTPQALEGEILRWLRHNRLRDNFHFRPIVTRGDRNPPRLDPRFCRGRSRLIFIGGTIAPAAMTGQKLVFSSYRRVAPDALDSRIKSLNYGNNLLARLEAIRRGADDAVMLDPQGFVAEASAANLFILRDGKLITPWPKACLEGITRSAALELAAAAGVETQERDITPTEVLNADEVFLTGTGSEIVPVVAVEGQEIGDGRAGPVTRDLAERYGQLVRSEGTPIWS
jgi:branched-chain amino acid aminotransferase